jgi:hypothetical protein
MSVDDQLRAEDSEVAMNLTLYVVAWALLALAVLGLALYRKLATLQEDDLIHLGPGEDKLIPQQVAFSRKLDTLDRWGKALTIITCAAGLMLAAVYLFQALTSVQ